MTWSSKQRITAMVIIVLLIAITLIFVFIYITTIKADRPNVLSLSEGTNLRIITENGSYLGLCNDGTLSDGVEDPTEAAVFTVHLSDSKSTDPAYQFINGSGNATSQQFLIWDGNTNNAPKFQDAASGTNFRFAFDSNGNNTVVISSAGSNFYSSSSKCGSGSRIMMGSATQYFILTTGV